MILNFAFLDVCTVVVPLVFEGGILIWKPSERCLSLELSGVFQYERGYALAKTFSMSTKTGYAVGMLLSTMCLCCHTTERVMILYHIITVRDMVSKCTRNSFAAFSFMVCVAFHEYMLCWFRIFF